jgi:hypothetical protein
MAYQIPTSLNDLLDKIGQGDPKLGMLVEFLKKRNADHESEAAEIEKSRKKIESKILHMERDYQILFERNNLLAKALGACDECWGTEEECKCGGSGRVGTQFPNRELFNELIVPVLEKYGTSLCQDFGKKDNNNQVGD